MLLDLYKKHQKEAIESYGDACIVFLENGHFYEILDDTGPETSKVLQICRDVLNLTVGKRDHSFIAGMPVVSVERHMKLLLRRGYTLVFVEQDSHPPKAERALTRVVSPGCCMDDDGDSGRIASVRIRKLSDEKTTAHVASFDCNTGQLSVESFEEKKGVAESVVCVRRFVQSEGVSEIVHVVDDEDECLDFSPLITHRRRALNDWRLHDSLLLKYFPKASSAYQTTAHSLGITDASVADCLISLLIFVEQHDTRLVANLNFPRVGIRDDHRVLQVFNSAYSHLNVFEAPLGSKSVFSHCNMTKSKLGERLLRERFRKPSTSVEEMDKMLDIVCAASQSPARTRFESLLGICDAERILRRWAIKHGQSNQVVQVCAVCDNIAQLTTLADGCETFSELVPNSSTRFGGFFDSLRAIFDMESCGKANKPLEPTMPFRSGVYPEIDAMLDNIQVHLSTLKEYLRCMRTHSGADIRIAYRERQGVVLEATAAQARIFCKWVQSNPSAQVCDDLRASDITVKTTKSNGSVYFSQLQALSDAIVGAHTSLSSETKVCVQEALCDLYNNYKDALFDNLSFVAKLDVAFASARLSESYGYARPNVISNTTSYFSAKSLRHPVLERLVQEQRGTRYVPNDVSIGDANLSMLLYGVNSVGKSSLLKSVAIAVIMAQAGLPVAAESLWLCPFTKLFARTGNMDDMYNHKSSYLKELEEVHVVLDNADAKSLIVSDELCSSTDAVSARRVVSAFMKTLAGRRSTFMISTHLFDLVDTVDERIRIFHMMVDADASTGALIFKRQLSPGLPPNRLYGVAIARKMIRDPEFIKELSSHDDAPKLRASRYNSAHLMLQCEICGQTCDNEKNERPLETHHIHMQCCADKNGFLNAYNIHDRHNLVTLCVRCHRDVHKLSIHIDGYADTSDGRVLEWRYAENHTAYVTQEGDRPHDKRRARPILERDDIVEYLKSRRHFKTPTTLFKEVKANFDARLTRPEFNTLIDSIQD